MTGEVVDRVADTVVDLERHFERLLEEEVSLVIYLSLIVNGPTVLLVETACDVTLPLPQTHHPVNPTLRINQTSAPARTHAHLGPCTRGGGLLLTSDDRRNVPHICNNRRCRLQLHRWCHSKRRCINAGGFLR